MNGTKPIVVAKKNRQQFYEHYDVERAVAEAERLATNHDDEFVVYVPVAICKKPPKVIVERLQIPSCWRLDDPPF